MLGVLQQMEDVRGIGSDNVHVLYILVGLCVHPVLGDWPLPFISW